MSVPIELNAGAPARATLQREHWNGQPTYLGDLAAACKLWTHNLGWEVRLEINCDLQQSEVFRSQDDVLAAGETRKCAMMAKGWVLAGE